MFGYKIELVFIDMVRHFQQKNSLNPLKIFFGFELLKLIKKTSGKEIGKLQSHFQEPCKGCMGLRQASLSLSRRVLR